MKIIDDSNWNEEGRKPTWREFRDGLDCDSQIFTLEKLNEAIDEEYKFMSENEKYMRMTGVGPTFLEWVFSTVSNKIESGQKIEIDEEHYMYRIIELNDTNAAKNIRDKGIKN